MYSPQPGPKRPARRGFDRESESDRSHPPRASRRAQIECLSADREAIHLRPRENRETPCQQPHPSDRSPDLNHPTYDCGPSHFAAATRRASSSSLSTAAPVKVASVTSMTPTLLPVQKAILSDAQCGQRRPETSGSPRHLPNHIPHDLREPCLRPTQCRLPSRPKKI